MLQEIEIPREVPVMTLSSAVLFPQAMMPLHIFEPRYRAMLSDVLKSHRIFAVAALNESSERSRELETPHNIASVGIIRACHTNNEGTSHLILQGLVRIEFEDIIQEKPYRTARIHQFFSKPGGSLDLIDTIQPGIISLVRSQIHLGAQIPKEIIHFFRSIPEPENMLDLAIDALCPSIKLKQKLLETRGVMPRYELFQNFLKQGIERLKLERKLRGDLEDEAIGNN